MTGLGPDGPADDADRTDDSHPSDIRPSDDGESDHDRTHEHGDDGSIGADGTSDADGSSDTDSSDSSEGNSSLEEPRQVQSRSRGSEVESTRATEQVSERPNESRSSDAKSVTIEDDGVVRWFFRTDDGTVVAIRDVLSSVAIVALIGLVLFGVSGVWPPMVAVESGSMEPNMERGDLVFVVDEGRFTGDNPTDGTGVVTFEDAGNSGHEKFGEPGDVIIFKPGGSDFQTPVIHRAHYWVEAEENWVESQADPENLNGRTCDQLRHCPAPHDGFITKGDANPGYDQAGFGADTGLVESEWVTGKAMFRVPWLGHVRLTFDRYLSTGPTVVSATPDAALEAGVDSISAAGFSTTTASVTGIAGVGVGSLALAGWRRYGS